MNDTRPRTARELTVGPDRRFAITYMVFAACLAGAFLPRTLGVELSGDAFDRVLQVTVGVAVILLLVAFVLFAIQLRTRAQPTGPSSTEAATRPSGF